MTDFIFTCIFNIAILATILVYWAFKWYVAGYRQGQIDCLNNKIKYEKQENEEGEITWKEITSHKSTRQS